MSVDLERDLRTYMAYLDEVLPTLIGDEAASEIPTLVPSLPPTQRRGWVVALGAAVVVLVVVGGLALLTFTGGSGGVDDGDVIAPMGPVELLPGQWVRVPGGEAFTPIDLVAVEGSIIDGMAAGENGLVAVGTEKIGYPNEEAAVWTSVDSTDWERLPLDPSVFGTSGRLGFIVAGGSGFVIAGEVDGAPGIWTSGDGSTWAREIFPADAETFTGLVASDGLLVAEGFVIGEDLNFTGIWTSNDGSTWSRVSEVASGGNPIVAAGPIIVVLGKVCEWVDLAQGIASCEPTVWTSPDGEDWDRHEPSGEMPWDDQGPIQGLVAAWFGDRLIALGSTGAWASIDGIDWTRLPEATEVFTGVVAVSTEGGEILPAVDLNDLASNAERLVAVGRARTTDGEVGAIWISTDGTNWDRVGDDPALFGPAGDTGGLRQVTRTSEGFVAVGNFTEFWVWTEPTP